MEARKTINDEVECWTVESPSYQGKRRNGLHQAGWLFLAILCLFAHTARSQDNGGPPSGPGPADTSFYFTTNSSTLTITGYYGTNDNIVIPSPINGYAVVQIGASAFNNNTNLTSVTIPNSVTSIGDEAFRWCSGLTNVTIPNAIFPARLTRTSNTAQSVTRSQSTATGDVPT